MTIDELKAEALRLNPEERAELASELLVSLDELSEPEVERMWLEEAMRRDAALDSGATRRARGRGVRRREGSPALSLGISFHEDARTEFDEATDFYGMERASLGVAPPRYNHPA